MSSHLDTLPGGCGGLLEQALDVAPFIATSVRVGPSEVLLEATDGHDGLGGLLQL